MDGLTGFLLGRRGVTSGQRAPRRPSRGLARSHLSRLHLGQQQLGQQRATTTRNASTDLVSITCRQ